VSERILLDSDQLSESDRHDEVDAFPSDPPASDQQCRLPRLSSRDLSSRQGFGLSLMAAALAASHAIRVIA